MSKPSRAAVTMYKYKENAVSRGLVTTFASVVWGFEKGVSGEHVYAQSTLKTKWAKRSSGNTTRPNVTQLRRLVR